MTQKVQRLHLAEFFVCGKNAAASFPLQKYHSFTHKIFRHSKNMFRLTENMTSGMLFED